jgi:hypothetical protein
MAPTQIEELGVPRAVVVILLAVTGCGPSMAPPESGAREAALAFFHAIIARDWPGAHAAVDADSRVTINQLSQLATVYRTNLKFEPSGVAVTACDENNDRAVVHVVITGRAWSHQRYKDVVTLRRRGGVWGVVLPTTFRRGRR